MEKLNDLKDLLLHEIHDLTSAEAQIIEALPLMLEKATNPALKQALKEHLRITEMQRKRLDQVNSLIGAPNEKEGGAVTGLFSRLFGGAGHKCKGMEGLIAEGNKVMSLDMNTEVLDAAIIACAQKIEHYEICGYGTARAYARELNLENVAILLEETLNEEYAADDNLTKLAIGGLNEEAEQAAGDVGSDAKKVAKSTGNKGVGAKRFFGNDKAPVKAATAPERKDRGAKKSAPNRRQVTTKGDAEERPGSSRGSAPRLQGGRPSGSPAKRSLAASAGSGRSKGASSGRSAAGGKSSASAGGRSQGAPKGRSSGGNRGPSKGGGSRGHK